MPFASSLIDDTELNGGCAAGTDYFDREVPSNTGKYTTNSSGGKLPVPAGDYDTSEWSSYGLGVGPLGWWAPWGYSGPFPYGNGVTDGYAYLDTPLSGVTQGRSFALWPVPDSSFPMDFDCIVRFPGPGADWTSAGFNIGFDPPQEDIYSNTPPHTVNGYFQARIQLAISPFVGDLGLKLTWSFDEQSNFDTVDGSGVAVYPTVAEVYDQYLRFKMHMEETKIQMKIWKVDLEAEPGWQIDHTLLPAAQLSVMFPDPQLGPELYIQIDSGVGVRTQLHQFGLACDY